MELFGNKLQLG